MSPTTAVALVGNKNMQKIGMPVAYLDCFFEIKIEAGLAYLLIIKDAYFLTWNPKISGKQPFSAFPKIFPYFLSFQEKKASFWGGTKIIIPGWSMHYIKHEYSYTIRSGLWAVIFSHFHCT